MLNFMKQIKAQFFRAVYVGVDDENDSEFNLSSYFEIYLFSQLNKLT